MYDPRYDIDMGNEIPESTPKHFSPSVNEAYSSLYGENNGKGADDPHYY